MTRGTIWSEREVRALIQVWGDGKIQEELDGAKRNKPIFEGIAKKMKEQGYNRDWQQCRAKIKSLKGDYRAVKDHNGGTGRGRKTCKFFSELDEILGFRPASVPPVLLESCSTPEQQSDTEDGDNSVNDGTDLHVESVDSGSTSAVPSEVVTEPCSDAEGQPEDEQALRSKKPKKEETKKGSRDKVKKTKAERAMEKATESFLKYQKGAEERFLKWEEERWRKESELEDRRKKKDQEHELRVLEMFGRMIQQQQHYNSPYAYSDSGPSFNPYDSYDSC